MTFKEAVEKLRAMGLEYATVQYEHLFHAPGRESSECSLYTEHHGGIVCKGKTWEATFVLLEEKIGVSSPSGDEAPDHDVVQLTPAQETKDDIPS